MDGLPVHPLIVYFAVIAVPVAAMVGAIAAVIASSSGEALAVAVLCAAILFALLAVNWFLSRKNQVIQIILSILLIGSSTAAAGSIYQAGHEGAKLVWSEDES